MKPKSIRTGYFPPTRQNKWRYPAPLSQFVNGEMRYTKNYSRNALKKIQILFRRMGYWIKLNIKILSNASEFCLYVTKKTSTGF